MKKHLFHRKRKNVLCLDLDIVSIYFVLVAFLFTRHMLLWRRLHHHNTENILVQFSKKMWSIYPLHNLGMQRAIVIKYFTIRKMDQYCHNNTVIVELSYNVFMTLLFDFMDSIFINQMLSEEFLSYKLFCIHGVCYAWQSVEMLHCYKNRK